jgi:hypothetical protein
VQPNPSPTDEHHAGHCRDERLRKVIDHHRRRPIQRGVHAPQRTPQQPLRLLHNRVTEVHVDVERHALITPAGGTWRKDATPSHEPIPTRTTRESDGIAFGPVVDLSDVMFRMLEPSEVAAAMDFPSAYQWVGTRRIQVRLAGNAVTPPARHHRRRRRSTHRRTGTTGRLNPRPPGRDAHQLQARAATNHKEDTTHRDRPPPRSARRPGLRIARPQGRKDDHRRHSDLRLRPNRPGPNRTDRCLGIEM